MSVPLSRYVHAFRSGSNRGAYDARRPALFQIDEKELQRLETEDATGLEELRAVGTENDGALARALNEGRRSRLGLPAGCFTDLRLSLTERCNMACDYCFQQQLFPDSQPRMSDETLHEAMSWFIGQSQTRPVTVQYFGGEPLLEWHHIVAANKMLQLAQSYGSIAGYHQTITTNGTVMTRERARWLIDHHFEVTFSFDGPPAVNDRHRVMRNGVGSSSRALRGLTNWVEEGGQGAILMTATAENLPHLAEYVTWFLDQDPLHITQVGINSPQPNTEGWETGGPELAETVFAIWKTCEGRGVSFHGPGTQLPQYINAERPQQRSCVDGDWITGGPGRWPVYIAANGERSLCLVHHNDKRTSFDETNMMRRTAEWHREPLVPLECDSCPALTVCGGPCTLERLLWGDRRAQEKCGFTRTMLDLVLRDQLSGSR